MSLKNTIALTLALNLAGCGARNELENLPCENSAAEIGLLENFRAERKVTMTSVTDIIDNGDLHEGALAKRPLFESSKYLVQCKNQNDVIPGDTSDTYNGWGCVLAAKDGDTGMEVESRELQSWDLPRIPTSILIKLDIPNTTITYNAIFDYNKGEGDWVITDIITDGDTCFIGVGDGFERFQTDVKEINWPATCEVIRTETLEAIQAADATAKERYLELENK